MTNIASLPNNENLSKAFLNKLYKDYGAASSYYTQFSPREITISEQDCKYIAFYLPQYHNNKDNNRWWETGFTEWTRVPRILPAFIGHNQPRFPIDLGYYDLANPEVQERQAILAAQYGIYAFCYYFYWFSKTNLLDMPLRQMVENRNIRLPFCLCWANESWVRRTAHAEPEMLMEFNHSEKDDEPFIYDIMKYFHDDRYIKVKNSPVLVFYRLPGTKERTKRMLHFFQEKCINEGFDGLYKVIARTDIVDPVEYGFDAAVEFPPHNLHVPEITNDMVFIDNDFQGHVYDIDHYVKNNLYDYSVPFPLHKCVFPGWDNSARLRQKANIYLSSPESYSEWLGGATRMAYAFPPEKRFVFINAWNEWGEGAYLEPDVRNGYYFLNATADVLCASRQYASKN